MFPFPLTASGYLALFPLFFGYVALLAVFVDGDKAEVVSRHMLIYGGIHDKKYE